MQSRKISLHTHPFVYECKQKCWQLTIGIVGIVGNERADFEARQATLGNMVYIHNAQSVAWEFLSVAKQRMLDEW
jgi:hypothetical protein